MMDIARRSWMVFGVTLIISACGQEQNEPPPEVIRPVKTLIISDPSTSAARKFPGRIEAQRRAEVSFRVPGKVIEIAVAEGESVESGQIIAKLDPRDYQLVVDDRAAILFRAQRDYERGKPLAKDGYVTKKELDRREAEMKSAQANLDLAKRDLAYTQLKAPFGGQISKRFVERFEEVRAKQKIMELRDLSALEVKFDVPEQLMLRVRDTESNHDKPTMHVSFAAAPGKRYALKLNEIATRADPATRTFEATYTMAMPKDLTVLPGMTATVTADLGRIFATQQTISVPADSIVVSGQTEGTVWVVDESTMTVSPKTVEIGQADKGQILIKSGLKPGDRIVAAGLPFLKAGMQVSLMPNLEQARERAGDTKLRRAVEQKRMEAMTEQGSDGSQSQSN